MQAAHFTSLILLFLLFLLLLRPLVSSLGADAFGLAAADCSEKFSAFDGGISGAGIRFDLIQEPFEPQPFAHTLSHTRRSTPQLERKVFDLAGCWSVWSFADLALLFSFGAEFSPNSAGSGLSLDGRVCMCVCVSATFC